MSTDTITLTRDADEWIAIDEATGVEARGETRTQALERLDDTVSRDDEARVVKTPETLGGKPRLEGTRIGVFTIGESIREGGQTVEEILNGYPDLSRRQVRVALEYYDDHPEAMDVIRMQRKATKYRLRSQSRAPSTEESETGA
ncbi:DUF433 domain-containing protein [Salinadaptatus halalkaliphilus]|uniref:DUF433 domain-containing protein n=1 Tax=Salinadaptatus halalkaliphilus TaxID=2419781 RepID=A0A4S3TGI3_9EURY|nr:DUF433 domain-containing protein [Salinadaptatus halalkaliphilus]THE63039.1 DUF433 domain-containing protein [Salinadaptatus halalkaliphilus]